ncbi:MAG: hypothetical protein IPG68_11415 [Micrococcales bacterium]|nr:hypothetical protein [Micrococcales bacterium]
MRTNQQHIIEEPAVVGLAEQGPDRRVSVPAAIIVTTTWAVAAGWWMPRGPLTTTAAIASILVSGGVGALAGILVRSLWAMALAPVIFVAVFELTRMGVEGPMVDGST